MLNVSLISGRSFKIINGSKFSVKIDGTQEEKDSIVVKNHGNEYSIVQKGGGNNNISINGSNFSFSGNSTISINGRSININGDIVGGSSNKESTLDILVEIPNIIDIDFSLAGHYREIAIGDVGNATFKNSGSGNLVCASSKNLDAKISGQGNITIEQIRGHIETKISGQGSVYINNAFSDNVDVKVSGQGNININGDVGDIDAKVSGMGNITVKTTTNRSRSVSKKVSGMGNIVII